MQKQSEQGATMKRLDLIINALADICDDVNCQCSVGKALAAACELRELKPVAWRWLHNGKPDSNKCFDGTGPTEEAISNASSAEFPRAVQYFYTAPLKPDVTLTDEGKTWQGLTSEELVNIVIKHAGSPVGQVFAIETLLREKNR